MNHYKAYYTNGQLQLEMYYENGIKHRVGGPAIIWYHENSTKDEVGQISNILYYRYGMIHRVDGPAKIEYDEDGILEKEIYYQNDKKHRIGGPAEIEYYGNSNENNKIYYEIYYENGNQHRIGGPSYIRYTYSKNIISKGYWQNGNLLMSIEYYKTGKIKFFTKFSKQTYNLKPQIVYNGIPDDESDNESDNENFHVLLIDQSILWYRNGLIGELNQGQF